MSNHKHVLEAVCLLECLSVQCSCIAHAAFLDDGATARIAALGGSYVAIADDAGALMSNPAGLGLLVQPQLVTDYSRLSIGLTDGSQIAQSYVGGAMPLSVGGALAGGWRQLNFDSLYAERTLALGYGRWVSPHLALGGSLKQLHVAYQPDNRIVDDFGNIQSGTPDLFAQNGTERSAYSTDLGALYRWTPRTTLGLVVQDLNEPNIALSDSDRDIIHRTVRVGVASEMRPGFRLAAGLYTRQVLENQRDWIETGGSELWFKENSSGQFGVRGSLAAGSREFRQLGTGASYRIGAFQMDYAFAFNLGGIVLGDTYGNHRFSLSYGFGKDAGKRAVPQVVSNSAPQTMPMLTKYPTEEDLPMEDELKTAELLLRVDADLLPQK